MKAIGFGGVRTSKGGHEPGRLGAAAAAVAEAEAFWCWRPLILTLGRRSIRPSCFLRCHLNPSTTQLNAATTPPVHTIIILIFIMLYIYIFV
jgi:hypothetical protein